MRSIFVFLVATAISIVLSNAAQEEGKQRYDNYVVYKIIFRSEEQRRLLQNLTVDRTNFNIWHSNEREMHLMVNPKALFRFRNLTRITGIDIKIMITNVQSLIDEETSASRSLDSGDFGWTRYYSLGEIEAWLDGILTAHPGITESFTIGQSHEGRNIRGIKISYKVGNPGIFIESNIHAREWITSATATWFINELLTSTRPEIRNLAENIDWYIVPVFNVDGFVYTHEKERMWRKTRQPVSISNCIGTDPNRNFDSYWSQSNGASENPCADDYAGPHPFSEPEVKGLADFVTSIKDRINILLAFHSYSQLLLSPYGHSTTEFPPNYSDLQSVAKAYADAVKALPYQTIYEYGASAPTLYPATGTTIDWAYNERDIKITYTIEFRDKGKFGFILPPVQILPNCEETMTGMLALVAEAKRLGYMEPKY